MKFIKQIERFQKIDTLIKTKNTGTPTELADKLEISRSHLYRLIDILIDYGAEIKYSRKSQSFYYSRPFNFKALLPKNSLSDNSMEKIKGGFGNNIIPSFFMRQKKSIFKPNFT